MLPSPTCTKCGGLLPEDSPGGVCPKCVFELGWGVSSGGDTGRGSSQGRPNEPIPERPAERLPPTQAPSERVDTPDIAELAGLLPQLELLELVGRGGMGAVYKARQKALDRLVAVKILPPGLDRDGAFAERFTREAQALAKLNHPNIVAIHDVGRAGGYYYFVMEYVDGANLRSLMQTGALAPAEALAIVPQVCEALQYAHDEGIVHRDIKPENILVDKKGRVKIADFGLAKLVGAGLSVPQLTGTYQVMGTFHYMAPEQFERPQEVDHRADIYSLGVVLYELLTRELPIGRFALPSQKAPIDTRLDEIVLRALEKDPPRRYQHASEVKTDVDAVTRGDPRRGGEKPAPAVPPPVPPVSTAPPAPPRALSVPIKIENLWGGFAEGHGILRFDGEELLLEFDVRESFFQSLRLGSHRAPLPLYDLSHVIFHPGWFRDSLSVQVSRFGAIAHLPGCDRGQLKLSLAKADRLLSERLAAAVEARLAGEPWHTALARAESLAAATSRSAAREQGGERAPRSPAWLFALAFGLLVPALVLGVFVIRAMAIADWFGWNLYFWPALGLFVASAACCWQAVLARRLWKEFTPPPSKPRADSAPSSAVLQQVRWPSAGLRVVGAIDTLALLALMIAVGYLSYTRGPPEQMAIAYAAAIFAARLAAGPLQIAAALRLGRLENRKLAKLGAALAMLPGSPAWFLGLPIGIWAAVVLRRGDVAAAFDARPPRSAAAAFSTTPLVAAALAGLTLVSWTWLTLPAEPAASRGDEKWVLQDQGAPKLSPAFVTRVELRPAQVQAIEDLLQTAHQKYLRYCHRSMAIEQSAPLAAGAASPTPEGAAWNIQATIRPFATRRALLEAATWKQIDPVLDDRQRKLARQCDLFSDLFLAGRGQVHVSLESWPRVSRPTDSTAPATASHVRYYWKIGCRRWFSNAEMQSGGESLNRVLEMVWNAGASKAR